MEHLLAKLEALKENFLAIEFNTIFESPEMKTELLETLNKKIAMLTNEDRMNEILQMDMFILDLDTKMRQLTDFQN